MAGGNRTAGDQKTMHDRDVRRAMWTWLHDNWAKENGSPDQYLFTNEFVVSAECRSDIAIIGRDLMEGFELKSASDTLDRLPNQVVEYSKVFDRCSVVLSADKMRAVDMVPSWWGVYRADMAEDGRTTTTRLRKPEENHQQDALSLAHLLWKSEALHVLEERHADKGVRSKNRAFLWERMVETIPVAELGGIVRRVLLARDDWRTSVWDSDKPGVATSVGVKVNGLRQNGALDFRP